MKRWKKTIICVIALVFAMSAVTGCFNRGANQKPNEPAEAINPNPSQEEVVVKIYFADANAMYLVPEEVTLTKDNRSLAELMVAQLIAGPTVAEHNVVLPPETRLLSLEVVDGIAYVNFSEEVRTKHWGGSTGETMTIYSVVNTLTQLPEVDKVQFLIEGEKEEVIWGHGYTLEPFEYFADVIEPSKR